MSAAKKPVSSSKSRPALSGVVRKTKSVATSGPKPRLKPDSAPTPPEGALAMPQPEIVTRCVCALEEKKAEAVRILDLRGKSSVADFFIIATGTSDPHLRALRIAVEKELDDMKAVIVGRETQPESGWCVVDAFEVIVHLFRGDQRDNYDIEKLWADSPVRQQR